MQQHTPGLGVPLFSRFHLAPEPRCARSPRLQWLGSASSLLCFPSVYRARVAALLCFPHFLLTANIFSDPHFANTSALLITLTVDRWLAPKRTPRGDSNSRTHRTLSKRNNSRCDVRKFLLSRDARFSNIVRTMDQQAIAPTGFIRLLLLRPRRGLLPLPRLHPHLHRHLQRLLLRQWPRPLLQPRLLRRLLVHSPQPPPPVPPSPQR